MSTNIKNPPIPKRKPDPDSIGYPLVDDNFKNFVTEYEGRVPYLYKDSMGNITTGIGFLAEKPKNAYDLGLYHVAGRRATFQEVEQAHKKVEKMPNGQARDFEPLKRGNGTLSNIRMRDADMDRILDEKLRRSERELRSKIPRFDSIPYSGRRALLDMQYNMGDQKFTGKNWPKLYRAIDSRDWRAAAKESHRKGIGNNRNQAINDMFMEADYWDKRRNKP